MDIKIVFTTIIIVPNYLHHSTIKVHLCDIERVVQLIELPLKSYYSDVLALKLMT